MAVNRFSAVKEQMAVNLQENLDEQQELDGFQGAGTRPDKLKVNGDVKSAETKPEIKINGGSKHPEPRNETKITRKTMTIPVVLDVAVKELKDSRNLGRQKGTSKNTEDDIIVEALRYFFRQKGEYQEALEAAEVKVHKYG